MAKTFTQLYVQTVFAVKGRQSLIKKDWRERLYQYITGIVRSKGQKLLTIGGMADHIHIFIGLKPDIAISDLVRDIKANSTNFINDNSLVRGKFRWQEGYGAFTYSHSQLDLVINYVRNQEQHHKTKTFYEEYLELLQKFDVPYDEKYLFNWLENVND